MMSIALAGVSCLKGERLKSGSCDSCLFQNASIRSFGGSFTVFRIFSRDIFAQEKLPLRVVFTASILPDSPPKRQPMRRIGLSPIFSSDSVALGSLAFPPCFQFCHTEAQRRQRRRVYRPFPRDIPIKAAPPPPKSRSDIPVSRHPAIPAPFFPGSRACADAPWARPYQPCPSRGVSTKRPLADARGAGMWCAFAAESRGESTRIVENRRPWQRPARAVPEAPFGAGAAEGSSTSRSNAPPSIGRRGRGMSWRNPPDRPHRAARRRTSPCRAGSGAARPARDPSTEPECRPCGRGAWRRSRQRSRSGSSDRICSGNGCRTSGLKVPLRARFRAPTWFQTVAHPPAAGARRRVRRGHPACRRDRTMDDRVCS